jgi:hypothetical protein
MIMKNPPDMSSKNKNLRQIFLVLLLALSTFFIFIFHEPPPLKYNFFDTFYDNSNNWEKYVYSPHWYGSIHVQDGSYIWEAQRFYDSIEFYDFYQYEHNQNLKDFDLSVDAMLATPEASHMCYGISFRTPSNSRSGYLFSVCDTQAFNMKYLGADGWEVLAPRTFSDAIVVGQWNHLEVSARGDRFVLSVNNVVVFEFTHSKSSVGMVYLLLHAHGDIPGTIMFDNFSLQEK